MKRIILAAVLIAFAGPAMAQNMVGCCNAQAKQTPQEAAISACFRNAPWVVPKGYYDTCIAKAKAAK
jgi:hypothetical protein